MGETGRPGDAAVLSRAHLLVSGRVQGVFYRASTARRARQLGLAGWVRNLPDGRVEAVFEGGRAAVEEAIAWCREGPPAARVTNVALTWEDVAGEQGFVAG